MFLRNTYTGILDRKGHISVFFCRNLYFHASARSVVFDRIITEVIDHLIEERIDTCNRRGFSRQTKLDPLLVSDRTKPVQNFRRKIIQIDLLPLRLFFILIKTGQLDNVIDQGDQALGFFIYII